MDTDTVVLRLVTLTVAAVLLVVLLPALLIGVLLAGVWSWRGWALRWLVVVAATPLLVTVPFGLDPVAATIEAVREVPVDGVDRELVSRALLLSVPLSVPAGAIAAAGGLWWRRLRSPSWRDNQQRGANGRARRRGRATARKLTDQVLDRHDQVLLGVDQDTGGPAGLPAAMLGRHTLVVGSTGSGKTTTATRLAAATLARGGGLVVVDLKGDPATITTWQQAAVAYGRSCRVWSFDGPTVYDPLAAGGVSERTRKVMALADWTEPYYRDQAEQLLQLTLRTLDETGERPTLHRLHASLTPDGLGRLHRRADGPAGVELARETGQMSKGRESSLESLRTKLALLTQAEYGPNLDPALAPEQAGIDLAGGMDAGDVVVISLDELAYGHIAARMAEVVLTDVAAAAGARLRAGNPRAAMVWVDEFSAMRPGPLASLFARVRSANLALLLSTQEVSDLLREDPTFRAAVATNVATVLAHRVHDPESAEWLAQLIGTRASWQETSQVEAFTRLGADAAAGGATGLGTVREVERYVVHPNAIKSLPDHHTYLARLDQPTDQARARRVRVIPLTTPAPTPSSSPAPSATRPVAAAVPAPAAGSPLADVPEPGDQPAAAGVDDTVDTRTSPRHSENTSDTSDDSESVQTVEMPGDAW